MQKKDWWKSAIFYQIYPRSFKDSNGDGIGDLQGIESKLDYLSFLGINAVWLNPVYASPNDDMGYDISDYEKIMPDFGTMADMDCLIDGLHKRGIRIIMDLVLNHTSDEHPWFQQAMKSRDNPYHSFYIWKKGKNGKEPNNWAGHFTPSAWKYVPSLDEYYLHIFSEKQPDLNWENPALRAEMIKMINFWLKKGIDGFRLDAINCIAKNPLMPDNKEGVKNENGFVFSYENIANQPALHQYLKELKEKCFNPHNAVTIGEANSMTVDNINELISPVRQELDMAFHGQFVELDGGFKNTSYDWEEFKKRFAAWQQKAAWNTLFWENHDQPRSISRFGFDRTKEFSNNGAKMLAVMMFLAKGTPFIYQGEEIGMTNCKFKDESELRDVQEINMLKEAKKFDHYEETFNSILLKGRDNSRTPMQWAKDKTRGFSSSKPWIKVNMADPLCNVEDEKADNNSILSFYQKLIALKKKALFVEGSFEMCQTSGRVMAYKRRLNNESALIVCNVSTEKVAFNFPMKAEVLLSSETSLSQDSLAPLETRVVLLPSEN